ncbi:M15 family metallopeptidase [Rickettsia endosymbiont of Oedothorax gibbosus]|uniref:M15 family metallopeptidase n=1 Tax=Rickettsia endosymbiont of Oedothorax gibbosus TaxID=931099 RepID=UPI0020256BE3|nr:M15 family metallopeptidase [Rickettsia endosymbiont of Oedothorax gibbosus]
MLNKTTNLPEGFEYLDQIDPTIIQHMMYYSNNNFIGEQIRGYKAPRAILTKQAAIALKNVQQDVKNDNYSLVIYDAYRPKKAVQHFVSWGEDHVDQKMKEYYYPYINKTEIFLLGYVAKQSAHSRGSTVDLTIIELGKQLHTKPKMRKRITNDGRSIPYFDDNTVDMYSSVDLMDSVSRHDSDLIDPRYLQNRNYLRAKMKKHNFEEYSPEWWHYTLQDEPYKDQYFNFDVE